MSQDKSETTNHSEMLAPLCAMVASPIPRVCARCCATKNDYCKDLLAQVKQREAIEDAENAQS